MSSVAIDEQTRARPRPAGPVEPPGEGPSPERVTVNLSGLSVMALQNLATPQTGMTKTDAINKALQFYDEIKKLIANGGAVYIREAGESEPERVRIF
jgi:hypothetical protein